MIQIESQIVKVSRAQFALYRLWTVQQGNTRVIHTLLKSSNPLDEA